MEKLNLEDLEEYYAEWRRKPHVELGWNFDGCQEFLPTEPRGRYQYYCRICKCHQSHHRRVVAILKKKVVEYKKQVVYTRCHKIHANLHNLVDGCQEFLPTTAETLTCVACGCHKSFHRNEITTTSSSQ